MSVDEILAKCRQLDGGATAPAAEAKPEPEAAAAEPVGEPAPAPASSGKKPSEMSVAEMLAAARGEKSKPAAAKPAAKKEAKPAAKPAAAAKATAPKREGPMDTASILAMARGGGEKKGPVSKAEAAAKAKPAKAKGKPKIEVPPMPEKPGYAKAPISLDEDDETRRGFLASLVGVFAGSSLAVGFTSLALTHLLWLLGCARFMFPNILIEPPTKFKVGFPGDYGPGQVQTKFKAQFGVWIVRHEYQGILQIYAIQTVCTHLGCTPNWLEAEQKFKCPCHGSGFYKDGINFEGPAPRPLERYAIRLADDGQLEVDKSRRFFEEKGEWKDSASFVPV